MSTPFDLTNKLQILQEYYKEIIDNHHAMCYNIKRGDIMFCDILKTLREQNGESRKELADAIGVSLSTISNYENSIRKPDKDIIWSKIASHYNVTIDYLMGVKEKVGQNISSKTLNLTTPLPILGSVAAGTGAYTDNDIIGYEEIPSSWINPNEQYVVLIVEGDSMYPKFEDGDKVLVKVQSSVDSGDYGIVLIDGDSAVIKKIAYDDNTIELISANPMYPTRRFENEDVLNLRVFGLVKKSWRSY